TVAVVEKDRSVFHGQHSVSHGRQSSCPTLIVLNLLVSEILDSSYRIILENWTTLLDPHSKGKIMNLALARQSGVGKWWITDLLFEASQGSFRVVSWRPGGVHKKVRGVRVGWAIQSCACGVAAEHSRLE